ncbi:MAG: GNAT family N-acetyltransferase [Anaerolineaceae bacterium]|nr:GNAT family N-acetyltransferase [Anaerolineaceae bacterium]
MGSQNYFLQSERLGFRHWSPEDIDLANALWGDADVTKLIGGPFSEIQVRERLATEIKRQTDYGVQYWPLFLSTNDVFVGCCGLRPYDLTQSIYEIGFHICAVFWGQGYAQEAAKTVIEYAFNTLGAKALFAGHNPANESSRRLLVKLGFEYTHDEYYAPTGLNHPSYLRRRS